MSDTKDIVVPDLGDFKDVEIIEVLVGAGDVVEAEQSLLTLETDKASMEVPAELGGTIESLSVAVGDTVNAGDVIGTMAVAGAGDGASADASAGGGGATQKESTGVDPAHGDASGARSTTAQAAGAAAGTGSAPAGGGPATAPGGDSGGAASGSGDGGDGGGASGGGTLDVKVPDIGESSGVEVIEVLVSVGDDVEAEQSLITLESDKASMEVPSPAAGTVVSIAVSVGDSVDEGSPVLTLETADGDAAASGQTSGGTPTADAAPAKEEKATAAPGGGAPAGRGDAAPTAAGGKPGTERSPAGGAPGSGAGGSGRAPSPTAHLDDAAMRRAHASPGVRRYAREHGADLSLIDGTGPKGRILKEDVTSFIKGAMENIGSSYGQAAVGGGAPLQGHGTLAGGGAGIPPIPEVDFSKFGEVERVELGRINKLSAANLHRAWLNVPMVTHHDAADITSVEQFRKELKATAKEGDPRVTGLVFHMKALAATLRKHPKLNSSLSGDGQALFMKKYVHVGIAVDTPNGLVVPVFRDVDGKSIYELSAELSDVSSRARAKKLKPDEMQGASMTISSLGGIGGTQFTPIVNPPEVAILGITRADMQPVWDGTEFVPRLMCPLDLSYDHRVVDGADAARFMVDYIATISDIRRLLL